MKDFVPPREIGTLHTENAVSVFNFATVSEDGLQQEGLLLPTREELAEQAYANIQFWMEEGHSQLLSREQALQTPCGDLKIAGESDLQHEVLAELVELPENYG